LNNAIEVKNISKSFLLSHQNKESYIALRDVIASKAKKLFSFPSHLKPSNVNTKEEFWALNDVSFDIQQGDRVGIIGRNGAGKSTLLKILSRITEPTKGEIRIQGRVASLLEVGTGFHPELTGRENIFLNGAILGMSRAEIKKKFDEIVEFAEVEKFLDTPVKRYSSGMYVRLAFAVAAHLEPEILIIDEVLAVGDAQFQRKCLGKMEDVSKNEGRTVIFVSHSMPTISSLCNKSILLDQGMVNFIGNTSEGIMAYYSSGNSSPTNKDYTADKIKPGDRWVQLSKASIQATQNNLSPEININEEVQLEIEYEVLDASEIKVLFPNFHVYNAEGTCVFVTSPKEMEVVKMGSFRTICSIPANFLNQGTYFVSVAISSFENGINVHFYEQNALSFNIKDSIYNIPTRPQLNGEAAYINDIPGVVRPLLKWQTIKLK
jgi:lipopolysaccharide transport system ATP-binding protein